MKKTLMLFLSFISLAVAGQSEDIMAFVRGSVVEMNATHFGLTSVGQLESCLVGEAISVIDVSSDSLTMSISGSVGELATTSFYPILVEGKPLFMVLVDSEMGPVSVGYRQLAVELEKMRSTYEVALEDIELYRSTQLNSFLFSLPETENRAKNLTLLQPDWDNKRSPLTSYSETVSLLKSRVR